MGQFGLNERRNLLKPFGSGFNFSASHLSWGKGLRFYPKCVKIKMCTIIKGSRPLSFFLVWAYYSEFHPFLFQSSPKWRRAKSGAESRVRRLVMEQFPLANTNKKPSRNSWLNFFTAVLVNSSMLITNLISKSA